jgi:large subunit ribosomal protein L25
MTLLQIQSRPFHQTKGQLGTLRKEGWIPAVVYGGDQAPQGVSVFAKQFLKELTSPGIYTRVFHLEGLGDMLVKAMDFPATKDTPRHIDFLRLTDRVVVTVPLHFTHENQAPGIKRGGLLNIIQHTLDISMLSSNIMHSLDVNLSGMDIGKTLHLEDLVLPEGSKVLRLQKGAAIVSIVAPSESSKAE